MPEKSEPLKTQSTENFTTSPDQKTGTLTQHTKAISELPATQKTPFISPHIVSGLPKPQPTQQAKPSQPPANTPAPPPAQKPSSENSK